MPCVLHSFSSMRYPNDEMVNFEWVPLGSNIAGSLFTNDMGDSAAIMRRFVHGNSTWNTLKQIFS